MAPNGTHWGEACFDALVPFRMLALAPAGSAALFAWGVLVSTTIGPVVGVPFALAGFAANLRATYYGGRCLGGWWAVPGIVLSWTVSALVAGVVLAGWQPWAWWLGPALLVLALVCLAGAALGAPRRSHGPVLDWGDGWVDRWGDEA